MATITRSIGRTVVRLALLALLALALFPPGPTAPAYAHGGGRQVWAGSPAAQPGMASGAKTFFVDPAKGKDTNAGTLAKPLRTLAKALSLAKAGATVQLAKGVYSKATNGEPFGANGLLVPSGVAIVGSNEGRSIASTLQGTGSETVLTFQGKATVTTLALAGFKTALRAAQAQQILSNIAIGQSATGLGLSGTAHVDFSDAHIVLGPNNVGVRASGQATLAMSTGELRGTPLTCVATGRGIELHDSARATLLSTVLADIPGAAIELRNNAQATLDHAGLSRTLPGACPAGSQIFAADAARLSLQGSEINSRGGLKADGIDFRSTATLIVNDSFITGETGTGIIATGLRLRRSRLTANGTGIAITGNNGFALADLGQAGDPGNNQLRDNSLTGVTFGSGVIQGGAFARGNSWTPRTQGADSAGLYLDGQTLNGLSPQARGRNFRLPNSLNVSIEL